MFTFLEVKREVSSMQMIMKEHVEEDVSISQLQTVSPQKSELFLSTENVESFKPVTEEHIYSTEIKRDNNTVQAHVRILGSRVKPQVSNVTEEDVKQLSFITPTENVKPENVLAIETQKPDVVPSVEMKVQPLSSQLSEVIDTFEGESSGTVEANIITDQMQETVAVQMQSQVELQMMNLREELIAESVRQLPLDHVLTQDVKLEVSTASVQQPEQTNVQQQIVELEFEQTRDETECVGTLTAEVQDVTSQTTDNVVSMMKLQSNVTLQKTLEDMEEIGDNIDLPTKVMSEPEEVTVDLAQAAKLSDGIESVCGVQVTEVQPDTISESIVTMATHTVQPIDVSSEITSTIKATKIQTVADVQPVLQNIDENIMKAHDVPESRQIDTSDVPTLECATVITAQLNETCVQPQTTEQRSEIVVETNSLDISHLMHSEVAMEISTATMNPAVTSLSQSQEVTVAIENIDTEIASIDVEKPIVEDTSEKSSVAFVNIPQLTSVQMQSEEIPLDSVSTEPVESVDAVLPSISNQESLSNDAIIHVPQNPQCSAKDNTIQFDIDSVKISTPTQVEYAADDVQMAPELNEAYLSLLEQMQTTTQEMCAEEGVVTELCESTEKQIIQPMQQEEIRDGSIPVERGVEFRSTEQQKQYRSDVVLETVALRPESLNPIEIAFDVVSADVTQPIHTETSEQPTSLLTEHTCDTVEEVMLLPNPHTVLETTSKPTSKKLQTFDESQSTTLGDDVELVMEQLPLETAMDATYQTTATNEALIKPEQMKTDIQEIVVDTELVADELVDVQTKTVNIAKTDNNDIVEASVNQTVESLVSEQVQLFSSEFTVEAQLQKPDDVEPVSVEVDTNVVSVAHPSLTNLTEQMFTFEVEEKQDISETKTDSLIPLEINTCTESVETKPIPMTLIDEQVNMMVTELVNEGMKIASDSIDATIVKSAEVNVSVTPKPIANEDVEPIDEPIAQQHPTNQPEPETTRETTSLVMSPKEHHQHFEITPTKTESHISAITLEAKTSGLTTDELDLHQDNKTDLECLVSTIEMKINPKFQTSEEIDFDIKPTQCTGLQQTVESSLQFEIDVPVKEAVIEKPSQTIQQTETDEVVSSVTLVTDSKDIHKEPEVSSLTIGSKNIELISQKILLQTTEDVSDVVSTAEMNITPKLESAEEVALHIATSDTGHDTVESSIQFTTEYHSEQVPEDIAPDISELPTEDQPAEAQPEPSQAGITELLNNNFSSISLFLTEFYSKNPII